MAVGFPKQKTYRGGFYDNKVANGNDRVYTAKDMRKPYDALFTDGIKPAADGTAGDNLKVNLVGGMVISVNAGYAKLGGAWFENTATYNITLESHSSAERYDCVILRNDDSESVRAPEIDIRSLKSVPTSADLVRPVNGVGDIYEVCLAYVRVPALEGDLTIVDTREDGQLCNVMSGVGAMVVRTYRNPETIKTTIKDQTRINIEIPQFNRFRDHLTVIVEGRILSSSAYTIPSNTYIELVTGLPVIGTKVDFEVRKNVNAAGADTVVQEVGGLLNDMANVNATLVHHYNCNGSTDNVNISRIVTDFHSESTEDYSSMRLVIHGTFGATSPLGGEGTADNAYYWFRAAQGSAVKRRVILDFTDCKQISINCAAGTTNIIFFGMDCQVIGANVIATGGTTIYMFSTAGGTSVYAENCRFWITCDSGGFIARSGTFKNCRATVRNSGLHSYCFAPISASLLRVEGGEYYAYTKSKEHVSAIVGLTSGENAVAILYAVNAPTADQSASGYSQTHSIYQTTGMVSCTDLISTLPLNVVTGQSNIRGTLVFSKPGLM
jgi:hypothetical protein